MNADFLPIGDDFPEPHMDSQPSELSWRLSDLVIAVIGVGVIAAFAIFH